MHVEYRIIKDPDTMTQKVTAAVANPEKLARAGCTVTHPAPSHQPSGQSYPLPLGPTSSVVPLSM